MIQISVFQVWKWRNLLTNNWKRWIMNFCFKHSLNPLVLRLRILSVFCRTPRFSMDIRVVIQSHWYDLFQNREKVSNWQQSQLHSFGHVSKTELYFVEHIQKRILLFMIAKLSHSLLKSKLEITGATWGSDYSQCQSPLKYESAHPWTTPTKKLWSTKKRRNHNVRDNVIKFSKSTDQRWQ